VNNGVGERFIVSAYMVDGNIRYMFALSSSGAFLIGFDTLPYSKQIEEAEKVLESVGLI